MKIQKQQALATVLDIQIEQIVSWQTKKLENHYVRTTDPLRLSLGRVDETKLSSAIWRAIELTNLEEDSNYAIFPIHSNREDYYMSMERELLRQEASPEFQGKKMWELMGADPREVVTVIMEQFRNVAKNVVAPEHYKLEMFRTACLLVASLQWVDDWMVRLQLRNAALKASVPKPPAPVPYPEPHTTGVAGETPNLFNDPHVVKSVTEEALDREARMNEADRNETPL